MSVRYFPLLLALLILPGRVWSQAGNDGFGQRITLTGAAVTAVSNLKTATHETGEPNHANNSGTRSLWWTWTAPATGMANFSTFGGGVTSGRAYSAAYTRALAVYVGGSLTSLSEVASAGTLGVSAVAAQIGGAPPGPSFNARVTAGTTYQIAVDGPASFDPSDDGTAVLAINQAPALYSPAGASGIVGGSFTYTIQASNNATGFAASGLPPGLSVNPSTGVISGVLVAAGSYVIQLTATNPGGTGTGTLTLLVSAASATQPSAPVVSSAATAAGLAGTAFSYYLSANGAVSYTAGNLPPGLTLDAASGLIAGTPNTAGAYSVPVTATNALGTGSATVVINIAAAPRHPIITSSLSATGTVGSSFGYSVSVADTSTAGKPTGYGASNLPAGLGFDPTSGSLLGTPATPGVYSVPISASNAGGTGNAVVTVVISAASASSTGTVAAAPPVLNSSAFATGTVGSAFSYRLAASNAPVALGASGLPPGLSVNSATGYITGTPTTPGVYSVPVSASNDYGTSNATLTLSILAAGPATSTTYPPMVINTPAEAIGYVGRSFSYTVSAVPGNSGSSYYYGPGSITYSAVNLPPDLTLTGPLFSYDPYVYITGTPSTAGTYAVTITATPSSSYYPFATTASATVTIVIGTGNAPDPVAAPVFTSAAEVTTNVGATFSGISVFAASNSPVSYAAGGLPPGLTLNASTGTVSGSPTAAGTYPVAVSATNAAGTGNATVTMVVAATAATTPAPGITSYATAAGVVGTSFTYSLSTTYTATSYTADNLPPGLTLSGGVISGTPAAAGVYTVPISAANAGGTTTAMLTVTITAAATAAPVISSYATARGTVGSSMSYTISVNGSATGYTADNLPPGLTLSGSTISGTPTTAGVWNTPITATNAAGTGTGTVTFTVGALAAPAFSCKAAASAVVGSLFSFNLYANAAVTGYTAANLPPGLSLGAASGSISGTPTAAGTYAVPVTATNAGGTTSATLTITVAAGGGAPVVSSAAAAGGVVGAAFSYTITASNTPTGYDLGATPPLGLSFNPVTGTLAGTPTAAGTYVVPIYAGNASGSGQAKVTLTFSAQPAAAPVITSPAMFQAYLTDSVYYPVTATNSPTSFAASGLPAGLSIAPATGLITGTLANSGTASFPVVVTATNSIGQGTATVVVVNGGPAAGRITSPLSASGVTGTAFNYSVTTNYTNYSFSAGNLPPGLGINASTGKITGTPTGSGAYITTVSVSTGNGTATGKVTFFFAAATSPRPVLTSTAGVNAAVGDAFYYFPTAANNPTSWSILNLPAGLSYDSAKGLISGAPTTAGTYSVGISAANGIGTTSGTLTVVVAAASNNIAKFTSAAGAGASVGVPFTYTAATNQPSSYSFSVTGLPTGLSYNANTLQITGTPAAAGVYTCRMTVYTSQGPSAGYLTITVGTGTGGVPLITSAAAAAASNGAAFYYALAATGSPASFTASGLPAGLGIDPLTGIISGTPTVTGTFSVPVSAVNAVGTGSATLTLVIPAVAPTLNNTDLTVTATLGLPALVCRLQAGNGATSYTASGLPPGLSLDPASGAITGTPTATGLYQTTVTAANAYGSAGAVINITVGAASSAPAFTSVYTSSSGTAGASFSMYLYTSGSGTITYAASGLPPGLYLSASTGQIFGAPTALGTYDVAVSATNAFGSDNAAIKLLISAPSLPVFAYVPAALAGRVGGSFYGSFSIGGAATCAVSGLPPGVNYSISYGYLYLQGTPAAGGTYPVTFTLGNAAGTSSAVVTMAIADGPPAAPVISSAAGANGYTGVAFQYNIAASNATPASFGASGLPAGLQLNPATGAITGTVATPGSYPATVTATNAGGTGSAVITLRFDAAAPTPNAAPVITSPAAVYFSLSNGVYYDSRAVSLSYAITASNTPASYAASGLPAGLSLNPYTGLISGRPLAAGTFTVLISATNTAGTGSAVLTIITPAALPVLSFPLTLGGTLGNWLAYTVNPYTSSSSIYYGSNTEPTTYSVAGLPPGLSFNASTGAVTGTPAQTGSFSTTVTATDRAGSVSGIITFIINSSQAVTVAGSAPVVYGNAVASGFVGVPLSAYVYGGSGFTAGNLPGGLGFNSSTGYLTGTPTAAGVYTVPVSATNTYGTGSAMLTVDIAAAPVSPRITSAAGAVATAGSAFVYAISTDAFAGAVWPATSYGAASLPPGLSFAANSGFITGNPTAAGTYAVPISATGGGVTGNATLALTVLPAPATPPAATPVFAGVAGTLGFRGVPFTFSPGTAGFTLDNAPPAGLAYNAASGTLSGLPTAAGSFDLPFSASGSGGGAAGHGVFNVRIIAPDLALPRITGQPAGGTVAQGGNASFAATASGAPAPAVQWTRDGVAVAGASNPLLELDAVQPADSGTYALVATNSSGRAASAGAALLVTQTYGYWQSANFSADEIAAGLAAPGYDFDGDGLSNLLEYALGRDPRTGPGGSTPSGSRPAAGSLQLQFTRDTGKTDLAYTVEASSDLRTWTPIARSTAGGATTNLGGAGAITESAPAGGVTNVTVQDGQPPGTGGSRFLRLRVDRL